MKKFSFVLMMLALVSFACTAFADDTVHQIVLNSGAATYDGDTVPEYDYAWHADPTVVHDEVKNAPAEYFTGTEPTGEDAVYIAHDIYYYPEVNADGYIRVFYDDDFEWVYYYPVEEYKDYIWANLPVSGTTVPTDMMHSEEDAWNNPVLHITQAGTYELSGTWQGQILIDLGDQDDTFADEEAKVTIILNGVDVTCTVAPALIFYSVYEADNEWEDRETYSAEVDISDAGAHVIIADDTENNFNGTNVYRMLKTKYKNEESTAAVKTQKKMRKTDGAFYSYQSMVIDGGEKGNGVLNIVSGFEGLDTELHLEINGGKVSIQSQDDGINVNEDGVSVVTINGGELHIVSGLGAEGDGVDSNGYLVVNGGVVISMAKPQSDSGLDSDMGSFVNGGYVVATGSTMDWAESDSKQVTMNLQFSSDQASDEAIIVTTLDGKVIFAYDPDKDETTGSNVRGYRGAVISSPEFEVGETYYVYVGGDVEGVDVDGLYDIETVTGFSGSYRQEYTGTDVRGFGRGGFGGFGGGRPDGGMGGGRPEDGGFPGGPDGMERPDDGFRGGPGRGMEAQFEDLEGVTLNEDGTVSISAEAAEEILALVKEMNADTDVTVEQITAVTDVRSLFDLFMGGMMGGMPDDMMGGPGGFPGADSTGMTSNDPSIEFYMNDTVNAFSGVSDEGTN